MSTPAPPRLALRVRVAGSPVVRRVGDKIFVLTADSTMHVLDNATAVWIWDRLVDAGPGGLPVRILARELADAFAVAPDRARADVPAFVGELLEAGVVEAVDDAGEAGRRGSGL